MTQTLPESSCVFRESCFFVVLRYWVCACLVRGLLPNSFVLKKHIKLAIDTTDQQTHNFSNLTSPVLIF